MPPRLRQDYVPRKRLLNMLYATASTHPLTLISAPPGYGKTTLLASLTGEFPGLPTTWIALEEEDNDPAYFLTSLLRALQQLNPDYGSNTQALFASLPNPAGETRRLIRSLINETMEVLPETWVILDDLHLITEPLVYASLDYLLERIPPQMHLIVATRHDPPLSLARLRARGQLGELRVAELRFTDDEACLFLNEKQCLGLSDADLVRLQSRAEGWAAGLRLLAGSLDPIHSPADRSAFIEQLALTDRYVFDFLADEVLRRQEPQTRQFLLEISILPEIVPSLCASLTGRKDAQSVLEEIYRRNLFLVQADERGRAYRFHALFAEFLCQQLKRENPGRYAELHRRAAESQKRSAPGRAVVHYMAAESWDEAAQTIEEISDELIRQGLLQTLHGWIVALPEPTRAARPRLLYLLGYRALERGELDQAMAFLDAARRGYAASADQVGQGETLIVMIDTASRQHDYAHQAALSQQALQFPLPVHGQVQLLMAQTWQELFQGDAVQADRALDRALALTLESDDPRAFHVVAPILTLDLAHLPGGTGRLKHYCRQVLARFGEGNGPLPIGAHSLLGYLLLLEGSVDAAVREAELALAISRQIGGIAYMDAQSHYVTGIHLAVHGDYAGMEHYSQGLLPWIEQTPALQPFRVAILFLIGKMQWLQHKVDLFRQTGALISARLDPEEYPEVLVSRRLMQALIDVSDHHYADAERTLRAAEPLEKRWPHAVVFGNPRILLAYLFLLQKREQEALALFEAVLAECEQKGTPGLILQETGIAVPLLRLTVEHKSHGNFARRLMNEIDLPADLKSVPIPETGEKLTRREIEVLQLIAGGASNQEIAGSLVLSEHTVKAHITSIFSKLQVASRTQAVARARELRII